MHDDHKDNTKSWIKNHPVLTGTLAVLSLTTTFLIATADSPPSQQPEILTRTPTGELMLQRKRATTYCSLNGKSGRTIFNDDRDLREVSFKKSGDITSGELFFNEAQKISAPPMKILEANRLVYEFDSYGTVNASTISDDGQISYGFRNFYAYLRDPINDTEKTCKVIVAQYPHPD